jgi:hypothetical protein
MATPLAQSMADPPPTAMSPSQPLRHVHRRCSAHGSFGGVRGRLVKDFDGQAGQGIECLLHNAGGLHALVRHDQGAA